MLRSVRKCILLSIQSPPQAVPGRFAAVSHRAQHRQCQLCRCTAVLCVHALASLIDVPFAVFITFKFFSSIKPLLLGIPHSTRTLQAIPICALPQSGRSTRVTQASNRMLPENGCLFKEKQRTNKTHSIQRIECMLRIFRDNMRCRVGHSRRDAETAKKACNCDTCLAIATKRFCLSGSEHKRTLSPLTHACQHNRLLVATVTSPLPTLVTLAGLALCFARTCVRFRHITAA